MRKTLAALGCLSLTAAAPLLATGEALDLSTDADVSIVGAAAEDISGYYARVGGDVNGDGCDDIVLGAWGYDDRRGKVEVIYGGPSLPSQMDLSTDSDVTMYGIATGDAFGYCLDSGGDVNDDGIADIVVGAWEADTHGFSSGEAYVFYGSRDLPATLSAATDADVTIEAAGAADYLSHALCSTGDVNGDGVADIVIGAYGVSGRKGKTYVFYGGKSLPANLSTATDADVTIQGTTADDASGHSISTEGDIDGDGTDDIVIGAYGASDYRGRTYVIYGDAALPALIDLADADLAITGENEQDLSGHCVNAAGDVNGDGYDDIAIGAFLADPGARDAAGAAYLVLGGPALPATMFLPASADALVEGSYDGDHAGLAVTVGSDTDWDGLCDMAVGAPWADPGGALSAGRAAVFGGGGLSGTLDFEADADVLGGGPHNAAWAGWWIAGGGDVNGDGIDDLAVGTYSADPPGLNNAGITYLLFGRPRTSLAAGWNLVSHMRPCDWPLAGTVLSDGSVLRTWQEAVAAGWVQEPAFYYEAGVSYKGLRLAGGDDDQWRAGLGYWVLNLSGGSLTLSTR